MLYGTTIRRALRGHLSWVFRRVERPAGHWHRSYVVTGKPKNNKIFQQLYSLVELCDFAAAYLDDRDLVGAILLREPAVAVVLRIILAKTDPVTWLVPTDESPGDGRIEHPYHLSTHIVLWFKGDPILQLIQGKWPGDSGTKRLRCFVTEGPARR